MMLLGIDNKHIAALMRVDELVVLLMVRRILHRAGLMEVRQLRRRIEKNQLFLIDR